MKIGSGQLFPLTLLTVLAALTFWLQAVLSPTESSSERKQGHDPDAIAENFEIRRLDDQGRVKYRLSAPHLVHYPDDDTTEITEPKLTAYRIDAPPVTLSSRHARVTAQGEQILLKDDVVITRLSNNAQPPMIARMPDLTVEPEAGIARTESPVEITQGASWMTGTGARLDNNLSTFELLSEVRGHYVRAGSQP
jgi:lipopolysaccharide export system protein LptC